MRNNEVVAIKKMSYSGKQTNEVTTSKHLSGFDVLRAEISVLLSCAEMAGHHQRGEVPAETPAPKHD